MKIILGIIGGLMALLFWGLTPVALAEDLTFPLNLTAEAGVGESVGTVTLKDSDYGLILQPDLAGLPEGVHGFHVHANPNCEAAQKDGALVPGLAAGGHFAPNGASHHAGPYGDGHLGIYHPYLSSAVALPTSHCWLLV
jgi:Cu-Zn family superoxide dismutase